MKQRRLTTFLALTLVATAVTVAIHAYLTLK